MVLLQPVNVADENEVSGSDCCSVCKSSRIILEKGRGLAPKAAANYSIFMCFFRTGHSLKGVWSLRRWEHVPDLCVIYVIIQSLVYLMQAGDCI